MRTTDKQKESNKEMTMYKNSVTCHGTAKAYNPRESDRLQNVIANLVHSHPSSTKSDVALK
jgi:hypothetical protein